MENLEIKAAKFLENEYEGDYEFCCAEVLPFAAAFAAKMLCERDADWAELKGAAECASNVLSLVSDEVSRLGFRSNQARERLRHALITVEAEKNK